MSALAGNGYEYCNAPSCISKPSFVYVCFVPCRFNTCSSAEPRWHRNAGSGARPTYSSGAIHHDMVDQSALQMQPIGKATYERRIAVGHVSTHHDARVQNQVVDARQLLQIRRRCSHAGQIGQVQLLRANAALQDAVVAYQPTSTGPYVSRPQSRA